MKLRVLIVDDEAPARAELRYMLEKRKDVEVVGEATTAAEALELIKALDYDAIFVDIQMPGLSGLHVAEAIKDLPNPPQVVFVTAYSEHAARAFDLDAVDYLVKPFHEDRLAQTIEKIAQRSGFAKTAAELAAVSIKVDRIPVERGGKTLLLPIDDIAYIGIRNNSVFVHTLDDSFTAPFTLKELEKRLAEKVFLRVNRGCIVNLHQVQEIIPMFGGSCLLRVKDARRSEILVSRRRAKKLKAMLGM